MKVSINSCLSLAVVIFASLLLIVQAVQINNDEEMHFLQSSPIEIEQKPIDDVSWQAYSDLTFTTLLEITEGMAEEIAHQRTENGIIAPSLAEPAQDSAVSFSGLLDRMKQSLVEHQQDAIDQYTKEEALCSDKLKFLAERLKHVNDTLVNSNKDIAKKQARVAELKPLIAKIISKLDPKAKDLEVIVKTIEQGTRRRAAQLSSSFKKINETTEMIIMLDQLATQLAATLGASNNTNASTVTFKFREQMKQMSNRISDPALQSLLASAIALADAGASSGNPSSSAALEGLGKMQKLLVLLDKEMHDYLSELKQAEDSSRVSWEKVLSTFAAERKFIQKDVERLLSDKKVATDEMTKLNTEIKRIQENIQDLPQKLDVLTPQYTTWRDQCRMKRQFFNIQSKDRENQLSTLEAVRRVSTTLQGTALQQALDQVAQSVRASRSA